MIVPPVQGNVRQIIPADISSYKSQKSWLKNVHFLIKETSSATQGLSQVVDQDEAAPAPIKTPSSTTQDPSLVVDQDEADSAPIKTLSLAAQGSSLVVDLDEAEPGRIIIKTQMQSISPKTFQSESGSDSELMKTEPQAMQTTALCVLED